MEGFAQCVSGRRRKGKILDKGSLSKLRGHGSADLKRQEFRGYFNAGPVSMRRVIKWVVFHVPFSERIINSPSFYKYINKLDAIRSGGKLKGREAGEIFSDIYKENFWENNESVSGDGSTLEYTKNLRKNLPELFDRFKIKSILDAPCGDFNWFRRVDRSGIEYTGGDVVSELIDRNNENFRDERTRFVKLNIIESELPKSDLWFCRDVLFHFSYADIFKTLENFAASNIRFLFTTTHTKCTANTDIFTGQFRLLNLRLEPFNLPRPTYSIDDWIDGYPERKMCLWTRQTIAEIIEKRKRS